MINILKYFVLAYLLVYLSTLFFIANAITIKFHDVDPKFQGYVNEFYMLVKKECPEKVKYEVNYYTITFADTPDPNEWIGFCRPSLNGYVINVDRTFWEDNRTTDIRRELMYHELSHCVIYSEHSKDTSNYMFPNIRPIMPKEVLVKQTIDNIHAYCNDGE